MDITSNDTLVNQIFSNNSSNYSALSNEQAASELDTDLINNTKFDQTGNDFPNFEQALLEAVQAETKEDQDLSYNLLDNDNLTEIAQNINFLQEADANLANVQLAVYNPQSSAEKSMDPKVSELINEKNKILDEEKFDSADKIISITATLNTQEQNSQLKLNANELKNDQTNFIEPEKLNEQANGLTEYLDHEVKLSNNSNQLNSNHMLNKQNQQNQDYAILADSLSQDVSQDLSNEPDNFANTQVAALDLDNGSDLNLKYENNLEQTNNLNINLTKAEGFKAIYQQNYANLNNLNNIYTYSPTSDISDTSKLQDLLRLIVDKNQNSAKIQLHPEELGYLEVDIEHKDNKTNIYFQASSPHAKDMIDSMTDKLKLDLANSGLDLGEVIVDSKQESLTNSPNSGENQRSFESFENFENFDNDDQQGANSHSNKIIKNGSFTKSDGLIDIYA